ncbi:MAG TPA: GDP-mannose 4,6-dehydratase [Bryobacteraceae bacterium]|nr:GDP-mannose 4,6-dehydratase [Bryobacteraceae bacterium]
MELRDKRILITGADGFIGSHLTELATKEAAHVRALVKYNSFNDWGWLEGLPCLHDIEVVTGDICDPQFCRKLAEGIDVIFHLAALIPIPYSYRSPDSYVDTNVRGTLNLCHAALAAGVRRFVHTSTSEVYGTAQYVPIDEKHPLNAQSPYSATKIGADAIVRSFFCSFELPAVIARPFNTYGPRQSARAVIPTIITQLAAGRSEVELGDLTATRDFTFVEDTCRGLMAVARLDNGMGEVFQIGSNSEISVGDLFQLIARLMASNAAIVRNSARMRPTGSEVYRLRCDNRKLCQASGFQPEVPLEEGLRRTIAWFRSDGNLKRYKEHLYNV